MGTKRTSNLPLICLVCGDNARGINFDLMTCMSCKTFFRRHVQKPDIELQCLAENNCDMTSKTRSRCSACRWKKCLALGMDRELVGSRCPVRQKRLPQPSSLSLLRNDRSTLTSDEWNLLSNMTHTYDAMNLIPRVKHLLDQQASLPAKLRSKSSAIFDITKLFFAAFQPFVERTPYFQQLDVNTCRTILKSNSATVGTINSFFIIREVRALDYPAFLTGCNVIYGHETIESLKKFSGLLEQNGTFVKLMLLILAFSTNSSALIFDSSNELYSTSSFISILHIQNQFLTMFWKYLLYHYGTMDAIRWFNLFIKYILAVIQSMYERTNAQHNVMLDTVIAETIQFDGNRNLTNEDTSIN